MDDLEALKKAKTAHALAVSAVVSSFIIPFSGIILGVLALRKGKASNGKHYKWLAFTGIFLSALPFIIALALVPFMVDCLLTLNGAAGVCFGVPVNV